jgi:poly-gamma-glutamate capsule biosynthesis protein CapA/YwtB (metallophosphatase superfamily)
VPAIATFATLTSIIGALVAASEPATTRIGFVGDVSFAGRSDPPEAVLGEVRSLLASPDLTLANLEGLFLATPAPSYREARLDISASPGYARALAHLGLDLIGTANNHAWDAGAQGVIEHLEHLAPLAIATFGSGASEAEAYAPKRHQVAAGCLSFIPATLKSNRPSRPGAHVAWYGAGAPRPVAALTELVAREHAAGCAPIVYIHWGLEGRPLPDAGVVDIGHALVDAGATLVVGHHPHVLQGVSFRADGAIAWSLGNFVFTNRTPEKRRSGMLEATLAKSDAGPPQLERLVLVPVTIDAATLRPRPATERERRDHLATLSARSRPFGTRVELVADAIVFSRGP